MHGHDNKPVLFTLENRFSMINLYYALELKWFMNTLLNSNIDNAP
jgi:hypothetical protein